MTMNEQVQAYKEDLALLPDEDAKMEYVLDFGKESGNLEEQYKVDDNVIKGCASLAWLHKEFRDGKIRLEAEGESVIAKGMLVMLLTIFNNRTPDEILAFDPNKLKEMGIMDLLSPVRQQGLEAFLNVIYCYARSCKEKGQ
jgi:cysteine desulfuration protein SufE